MFIEYYINTSISSVRAEVPKYVFNHFLQTVSTLDNVGKVIDHKEEITEDCFVSYMTFYDAYDLYGECLGTFAMIYEKDFPEVEVYD